jgi:hypothetical protein
MISQDVAAAVAWAAVEKVAGKEGRRELLDAGADYDVDLAVRGNAGGRPVEIAIEARLKVNPDSERTSSSACPPAHLAAYLLAKLPAKARAAILRDLPDRFVALGERLPAVDAGLLAEVEDLLTRLKARKVQAVRGSILCDYTLDP